MAPETPQWMSIASKLLGTEEVVGNKSSDIILKWAKELGGWIEEYYTNDSIPWCGLFVTYVMHRSGYKVYQKGLSAKAWLDWGKNTLPREGAIMVFNRPGGHHVTFCHGYKPNGWNCLGGNQHDEVNVSFYDRRDFIGCVWPTAELLIK